MSCVHTGRCGGCTYYNMPYEDELKEKESTLRTALGEYAALLDTLHPARSVEGYRNKMELAFGDTGKPSFSGGGSGSMENPPPSGECPEDSSAPALALGIRKKRSLYEVATTENCVLMPGDFKQIAAYTMGFFRDSQETVYHRKKHTGTLRHLVLRRGHFTGETLVILSTTSGLGVDLSDYVQGLRALPTRGPVVGILYSVNDGVADVIKTDNVKILWGRDYYREVLDFSRNGVTPSLRPTLADIPGVLSFNVSAFSFFQTNSCGAQALYALVGEYAGSGALAYDLYCGTGTIAQVIAPAFGRVIGVELVPAAVEAARGNAHRNNLHNCEFRVADITKTAIASENDTPPDAIIADPPRDGLTPKALAAVAAMGAKRIVYVACKCASLARDIPVLAAAGYTPTRLTAVDLFPRTPHVEVVCLLEKV